MNPDDQPLPEEEGVPPAAPLPVRDRSDLEAEHGSLLSDFGEVAAAETGIEPTPMETIAADAAEFSKPAQAPPASNSSLPQMVSMPQTASAPQPAAPRQRMSDSRRVYQQRHADKIPRSQPQDDARLLNEFGVAATENLLPPDPPEPAHPSGMDTASFNRIAAKRDTDDRSGQAQWANFVEQFQGQSGSVVDSLRRLAEICVDNQRAIREIQQYLQRRRD